MSPKIDPNAPLINRPKLPDLQQPPPSTAQPTGTKAPEVEPKPSGGASRSGFLRPILAELSAGREYVDDKSFKNYTLLTRSLEKLFSTATKVDRETATAELQQGGLRRLDSDLRKLLKGLELPAQLAKQLSREMTAALAEQGLAQEAVPLTSFPAAQQQAGYSASGLSKAAATLKNRFLLSSSQVAPTELSLNLHSGEISVSRRQSTDEPPQGEGAAPRSEPMTENAEVAARITSDANLLKVTEALKQSPLMRHWHQKPSEDAGEALFFSGLEDLQALIEKLENLNEHSGAFESLLQIDDLRIDSENGAEFLRFTLELQAPVGLIATDASGRSTTVYPRPNGSYAKLGEDAINISV